MGPQRRLGIYIGCDSPSIIRYLEPQTGDVFTARFADCHFDEKVFPVLGGENKQVGKEIKWCVPSLLHLDPPTKQSEIEVRRIMHLQSIANQLPDAFADTKTVTKSYIPAANVPARIEIPQERGGADDTRESKTRLKRGRPVGAKDKNPRKRKEVEKHDIPKIAESILEETNHESNDNDEHHEPEGNHEISINYIHNGKIWDRNKMDDVNDVFSYLLSKEIDEENEDPEPKSVYECQKRHDWIKWKDAIQVELDSLNKRNVFGPIVLTPEDATPLSTPMVVRSLNVESDPFRPPEENEEILGPEVPYLSAIGALMYLANCTRPDISFSVNLLARFSSSPTRRHWNGIKHVFRYLQGTIDLGLFYTKNINGQMIGFADAGYLSDPHKARSQTGYVFMIGGTAISWRSQKQTLVATSSNHAEIIALHEASRECVWLRSISRHIQTSSGIRLNTEPTILYEDNVACVAQTKEGYIKSDRTKHIPPKFFSYTQELVKNKDIEVRYVRSSENSADLFTKSLPTSIFRKHVHNIGMRRQQDI
ncbi:hypothetical protein ISN44_As08g029370 [Arabidopsis suecica]|uniref:Uncharacterized protein n=1 Tax=Arabidopsis suecica TaxID=45249 RepID=A0A8T2BD29_ARASU|nr:hypothetical protein ISN44_As08g029370 [Arabidopsis suecica]